MQVTDFKIMILGGTNFYIEFNLFFCAGPLHMHVFSLMVMSLHSFLFLFNICKFCIAMIALGKESWVVYIEFKMMEKVEFFLLDWLPTKSKELSLLYDLTIAGGRRHLLVEKIKKLNWNLNLDNQFHFFSC